MDKTGVLMLVIVGLLAFWIVKDNLGLFAPPPDRSNNPTGGTAPAGATGNDGLLNDAIKGVLAAITLGSQYAQANSKTN